MGQIVSLAAKPKRCNLNQLSQVPTPAAGEYILVSSDNSMNAAGQGNFDCYIIGVGNVVATELPLHKFKAEELDVQLNGIPDVTQTFTLSMTAGQYIMPASSAKKCTMETGKTYTFTVVNASDIDSSVLNVYFRNRDNTGDAYAHLNGGSSSVSTFQFNKTSNTSVIIVPTSDIGYVRFYATGANAKVTLDVQFSVLWKSGEYGLIPTLATKSELESYAKKAEVSAADATIIEQVEQSVKKVISDKVDISAFTNDSCQTGVAKPDGTIASASSQRYTEVENLTEGQIFTLRGYYISSGGSRVYSSININSVCAYSNGAVVSGKGVSFNADLQSYTIPSGIDKIRFTFSNQSTYANIEAVFTTKNAITTFYPQQIQDGLPFSVKGSMEADTVIMLPVENVTCNKAWIFSAKIPSSIGTIKIGECDNSGTMGTPRIEVDGTYVKTFSYTSSSSNKTFEHGLTIGNDIQVIVSQGWSHKVDKIIIQSGGNRWVSSDNNIDLGEETNRIGAVSTTALENAIISKSMFNIDCPIWVFGDSWVSYYPQRWVEQAVELGYGAWFLNGFAGEKSERGLAALRSLIGRHIPRVLLWLYGMNDQDTNDSTVNVSWQSCYNEVVSICENNNIDLVLATIPTTPTRNNNAKNAIVTSSGHRYVDQVAAMGADTSGNWISGYQSQDGNHTTEAGAKALMARFFADVPELMWSK